MTLVENETRAKIAHVWERDPLDWYVEPESATDALLRVEGFAGRIWDPCCGGGNIVNAMRRAGLSAAGTDVVRRVPAGTSWFLGAKDFLNDRPLPVWSNIVMNPPFFRAKGAEAFIRRAYDLASSNPFAGKIAAFCDIRFIAGDDRAGGLFAELRPARIWIITPRVSCPPGAYLAAGNKAGGGSSDWCWLVWDVKRPAAKTEIDWLRRAA